MSAIFPHNEHFALPVKNFSTPPQNLLQLVSSLIALGCALKLFAAAAS